METLKEYLERYRQWLKFQKGKAVTRATKLYIESTIIRIESEIKYLNEIKKYDEI